MSWTLEDEGLPPARTKRIELPSQAFPVTEEHVRLAQRLRKKSLVLHWRADEYRDLAHLLELGGGWGPLGSSQALKDEAKQLLAEQMPKPRVRSAKGPAGDSVPLDVHGEPTELTPRDWWPLLTGEEVGTSGRARCPNPGHTDTDPSCIVYAEVGRGWYCPVCQAGGTALNVASYLTGITPREQGYWRLREWIGERL